MSTQGQTQVTFNSPTIAKWIMMEPENAIITHRDNELYVRLYQSEYLIGKTQGFNGNAKVKSWKLDKHIENIICIFVW